MKPKTLISSQKWREMKTKITPDSQISIPVLKATKEAPAIKILTLILKEINKKKNNNNKKKINKKCNKLKKKKRKRRKSIKTLKKIQLEMKISIALIQKKGLKFYLNSLIFLLLKDKNREMSRMRPRIVVQKYLYGR